MLFLEPNQWLTIDELVTDSMAAIVGAQSNEVVMMNSLTSNIHFMMAAFYHPTPTRHKILIEKKSFPSDIQAMMSQITHHNYDPSISLLEIGPREGEETLRTEDILAYIQQYGHEIAIIHLSGIQYYTGQFFDISAITTKGHNSGCIVGFDLAHAVGNVPLHLHDWGVDFACWCSYKYLNCGPGSIGGCFVHAKHTRTVITTPLYHPTSAPSINDTSQISTNTTNTNTVLPRLAGWWGHRCSDRFDMTGEFVPENGAFGFRLRYDYKLAAILYDIYNNSNSAISV